MDINKAKKPIHIRCPHCKKDLQYNGASIKSRKIGLINRLESLKKKLSKETTPSNKKVLKKRINETMFELKLLSEDVAMLSEMSELEVLKIYKRKSKQYLGDNTYKKLIEEAEKEYLDENTFNYYDLAIQKYTDYDRYIEKR